MPIEKQESRYGSRNRPALPRLLRSRVARWIAGILGSLLLVVVLAVTAVYVWPLGSDRLQHAQPESLDFAAATAEAQKLTEEDTADPTVRAECRSMLLTHGTRTARAVLMLHGYTSCPDDYRSLARLFYDRGYNVFVPRAPRHGLVDTLAHAKVTADELVGYATHSLSVTSGLGDDVGVVGISGGGVLATWLTEYRPDVVAHSLIQSPFYLPNSAQAPGFVVKPLTVLFGFRVLPDHIDSHGFSFAALSQYLRIRANYRPNPVNKRLRNIAVAVSDDDTFIDHREAIRIPQQIAETNGIPLAVRTLSSRLGLGHDIAAPNGSPLIVNELNPLYFDLYEGTQSGTRAVGN